MARGTLPLWKLSWNISLFGNIQSLHDVTQDKAGQVSCFGKKSKKMAKNLTIIGKRKSPVSDWIIYRTNLWIRKILLDGCILLCEYPPGKSSRSYSLTLPRNRLMFWRKNKTIILYERIVRHGIKNKLNWITRVTLRLWSSFSAKLRVNEHSVLTQDYLITNTTMYIVWLYSWSLFLFFFFSLILMISKEGSLYFITDLSW